MDLLLLLNELKIFLRFLNDYILRFLLLEISSIFNMMNTHGYDTWNSFGVLSKF